MNKSLKNNNSNNSAGKALSGKMVSVDQFNENEKSANRIVVIFSLAFFVIFAITRIGVAVDYSESLDIVTKYLLLPTCIAMIGLDAIAFVYKFSKPWIKYMLIVGVIVICAEAFFIFTIYVFYLVFIPIYLATRYFEKNFIILVSVFTEIVFIICCVCNFWLSKTVDIIEYMHNVVKYNSWNYVLDTLLYVFIPITTIIVFYCIFGVNITKSGNTLINYRIEDSTKIALVNAELDMAADIQNSALPSEDFISPDCNFSIKAKEVPAREVGGDFYDYFMLDDNTLAFLVADVSDKGVPAAMFMMSAKKAIRCAAECCHTLNDTIELMNKLICQDNKSEMFLTLWFGLIDTRTGVGKYVNAGHLMPVLKSADGNVRLIENEPDLMLGNFPEMTPSANYFYMEKGDTLVLYTDGITDAVNDNGESFGQKRFIETIGEAPNDGREILDVLWDKEKEHIGDCDQFDDMTVLTLKCENLEEWYAEHLEADADLAGTKGFIDSVENILIKYGCPDDTRRNVETVIDEICTNIVDYAYDGKTGRMGLDVLAGHNYIKLIFLDWGTPFNPLEKEDPEFTDEPQIGGLGIYLVKNLTEYIKYKYEDGKNILSCGTIWGM